MKILGFETSTAHGGVGLIKDSVTDQLASMRTKSHSEVINRYIEELLQKHSCKLKDFDYFALGIGPGSFTGIRVAVNTVKAFAYSFDRPIIEINSLENLAFSNRYLEQPNSLAKPIEVLAVINAYKNMVYLAEYAVTSDEVIETKAPRVVRIQDLQSHVEKPVYCVGDGYLAYEKYFSENLKKLLVRNTDSQDYPQPVSTAQLAQKYITKKSPKKWHEVLPLYLRASEAEENKQGIKYQAL